MLNQYEVDNPTLPINQCFSHRINAKPFSVNAEPQNGPPSIWDTHGISEKVFSNPTASCSAPYAQR